MSTSSSLPDIASLSESQLRRVLQHLQSLDPELVQSAISLVLEDQFAVTRRMSNLSMSNLSTKTCPSTTVGLATTAAPATTITNTYQPPLPLHNGGIDSADNRDAGSLRPPTLSRMRSGASSGDLQPMMVSHDSSRTGL